MNHTFIRDDVRPPFKGFSSRLASRRIAYFVAATLALTACKAWAAQLENPSEREAQPAPAMSYQDEKGQNHSVTAENYKSSKLTAIHFWATWCAPCVEELPSVDAAQEKYKSRGLNVLTIALDGNNHAKVQKFFKDHKITHLKPYLDGTPSRFYAIKGRGLPTTLFVDSAGNIIGKTEGPMDWKNKESTEFFERRLK